MTSPCDDSKDAYAGYFQPEIDVEAVPVSIATGREAIASVIDDAPAWIDSDDPDSVRVHASSATDDGTPKWGAGFWKGCLRDGHCKHAVIYFALIVYTAVWIAKRRAPEARRCFEGDNASHGSDCSFWTKNLAIIPFVALYLVFWLEFCFSSSNRYLRNTLGIPDALRLLDTLYRTKPTLNLSMECYHYVTHVTRDSKGRTRTTRRKVTTWRGTEPIVITRWEDITADRLHDRCLHEYQLTKVKLDKSFVADENYSRTKSAFVQNNRHRDRHYNLYVNFYVQGFEPRLMTYVRFDAVPWLVGWDILVLCHALLLPALPYRIWLSSITGKVETNLCKKIETA